MCCINHRRRLWGTCPRIIVNAHAFITFYHLLPPNIFVFPPNIFDKSTPVVLMIRREQGAPHKFLNLGPQLPSYATATAQRDHDGQVSVADEERLQRKAGE